MKSKAMLYSSVWVMIIALVLQQPPCLILADFILGEDQHRYCGEILIQYPFGTNVSCAFNENFVITCGKSSTKPEAILPKLNLEVLEVRPPLSGGVTVGSPTVEACGGSVKQWNSINLSGTPFFFDTTNNVFVSVSVSVGGNGSARLYNEKGRIVAACNNNHQSICQIDLRSKKVMKKYRVEVESVGGGSCRSAFLTSRTFLQANLSITMATSHSIAPLVLGYHLNSGNGFRKGALLGLALVFYAAISSAVILSVCCSWWCWLCKTKRTRKEFNLRKKYFKQKLNERHIFNEELLDKTKLFSQKKLKRATNNFSTDRIVGRGGQGTVFKGMQTNGQIVAIKKTKALEENQWKEFINEVILLSQVTHRNIVKLYGCCLETQPPLLVYEFISNGTLSQQIHDAENVSFTWEKRVRIACEAAGAIAYLHTSSSPPIYHRDIKSSNILLDDKYQVKVSDFGISKTVAIDQTHMTTCVKGTFGYLDPEYFESGQFTEKSDVYSFGVVLVELLTGQHPIRVEASDEERSLVDYFLSSMKKSTLEEILDPIVLEGSTKEEVMIVANVAKCCLNIRRIERPTMHEVVMELERLRKGSSSQATIQLQSEETDNIMTRSAPIMDTAYTSSTMDEAFNITHSSCEEEHPIFITTW